MEERKVHLLLKDEKLIELELAASVLELSDRLTAIIEMPDYTEQMQILMPYISYEELMAILELGGQFIQDPYNFPELAKIDDAPKLGALLKTAWSGMGTELLLKKQRIATRTMALSTSPDLYFYINCEITSTGFGFGVGTYTICRGIGRAGGML